MTRRNHPHRRCRTCRRVRRGWRTECTACKLRRQRETLGRGKKKAPTEPTEIDWAKHTKDKP